MDKRIKITHAGFTIKGKVYQIGDVVDATESDARYAVGSKSAVYVEIKEGKYTEDLKGPSPEPARKAPAGGPSAAGAPSGEVTRAIEDHEKRIVDLEKKLDEAREFFEEIGKAQAGLEKDVEKLGGAVEKLGKK